MYCYIRFTRSDTEESVADPKDEGDKLEAKLNKYTVSFNDSSFVVPRPTLFKPKTVCAP